MANAGISYNRFHSTAMCSPTRASLLTGRNHTRVGNGQIAALANDFDGFSGIIPNVLGAGRIARSAPGYEGMGRQV
jgi:arylsulfatase A-like enzyme